LAEHRIVAPLADDAGALLSERIESAEVVAWPELGPEALRKMTVRDFPCIVIDGINGSDLYEERRRRSRTSEVKR